VALLLVESRIRDTDGQAPRAGVRGSRLLDRAALDRSTKKLASLP
jgi:hypothetical protein